MKRLSAVIVMACLFIAAGCEKQPGEDLGTLILGQWDLVDLEQRPDTKSLAIGSETVTVVLSIMAQDNMFYLEQQLGDGRRETFFGKWLLTGKILSGEYSDKTPWGQSYEAEVIEHDTLRLSTENGKEIYIYRRLQ